MATTSTARTKKTAASKSNASKKGKAPRKTATRKRKPKQKKVKLPVWAVIAAAVTIVLLLIVIPALRNRLMPGSGEKLPDIAFSSIGIDISHNNKGPIIWDSLYVLTDKSGRSVNSIKDANKVYPIKFVFIKASEGQSMKDPDFKKNWKAAADHDIERGAYHFFRSSKDGAAQAKNFIDAVGELRLIDLPPVLDIETMHKGCTQKLLNERALQWLKAVEKRYGRKPIVYASESFIRDVLCKEITDNYPIWVAHYGVQSPKREDWDYWQFTERGTVYGIPGPVDLDFKR